VYLTPVSAPLEIGGLKTADPSDPGVRAWWLQGHETASFTDFPAFVGETNSEGNRPSTTLETHADGANMIADARGAPRWHRHVARVRLFQQQPDDRAKQAPDEFVPLDGKFRDNVILQVKNGPIDFSRVSRFIRCRRGCRARRDVELQITKEYLGFATHRCTWRLLFEEVLRSDTTRGGRVHGY